MRPGVGGRGPGRATGGGRRAVAGGDPTGRLAAGATVARPGVGAAGGIERLAEAGRRRYDVLIPRVPSRSVRMSVTYTCPECGATLRPARALPAGTQVKGPKCAAIF